MGDSAKDRRKIKEKRITGSLEVLLQMALGPIWDGDICSKAHRTHVVERGLATRYNGYNFLTRKGVVYLCDLGYLRP
jgi:hypothetical protein